MRVALCICTRNRPGDLRRALQSVAESRCPPDQVVVSDDSDLGQSAEAARSVCAEFACVQYVSGPKIGLGANRNNCLRALAPAIEAVSFIDDDVIVAADFFCRVTGKMAAAAPRTIITGAELNKGRLITPSNCSFWGHQEVRPRGANDFHAIVINATLFPRSLFQRVCFDDALRYGSEEIDICAQAEAAGYTILCDPEIVNEHHPSPINRAEYARFVEASRLYTTYKRYRWMEKRPAKANAFALFAPLHAAASAVKRRRWRELAATWSAAWLAAAYASAEARRRAAAKSENRFENALLQAESQRPAPR